MKLQPLLLLAGALASVACGSNSEDLEVEGTDQGAIKTPEVSIADFDVVETGIDSNDLPDQGDAIAKHLRGDPKFVGFKLPGKDFGVLCPEGPNLLCRITALVERPGIAQKNGSYVTTVRGPLAEKLADVFAPTNPSAAKKVKTDGVIDCRRNVSRSESVVCEIKVVTPRMSMAPVKRLMDMVENGELTEKEAKEIVKRLQ